MLIVSLKNKFVMRLSDKRPKVIDIASKKNKLKRQSTGYICRRTDNG